MIKSRTNFFFYFSILGGILIWFFILLISPVYIVNEISNQTFLFISLCYTSLIVGYVLSFRVLKRKETINPRKEVVIPINIIKVITYFIILCFIIRYIDIFYFRSLRFSNTIYQNRFLFKNGEYNFIFIVSNVFKTLYFVPLLLISLVKKKNNFLFFLSISLFFFPFLEAVLMGSRSPFLQSFVLLTIILFFTKKIKFNKKTFLFLITSLLVLFIISTQILISREGPKNKNPYSHLVKNAIYNDFLKPKSEIVDFMIDPNVSNLKKNVALSGLQVGQYYTHGVFEFDNLLRYYEHNHFKKQYGKFTFFVFPKFTNYLNLTKINIDEINKSSPREYVFITFFGGLYLDFGWSGLIVIFLLGYLQGIVSKKITIKNYYYAPLFIFFIFTNFFLLTINFFRGAGTYTFISCIIFAVILSYLIKLKLNEKGIST